MLHFPSSLAGFLNFWISGQTCTSPQLVAYPRNNTIITISYNMNTLNNTNTNMSKMINTIEMLEERRERLDWAEEQTGLGKVKFNNAKYY